jgi:hypothetical protein
MEETLREVEFRDGNRWIPAYLADMMFDLKTHTMTYEEAVSRANTRLGRDYLDKAYDRIISNHFRTGGS